MARKGTLAPKVTMVATMKGGTPRCQFVKAPKEGKKWGEQCKNPCYPNRPRCKYHGGKAGRPPTHHRRSKYQPVPKGLQANFEKAMVDPELLNMWSKIALIEAQIWQIGEKAAINEEFTPLQTKKLLRLMAAQKSLIAQETVRRQAMGTMLPIEKVMIMIKFLSDSINRHVPDKAARARIGADLRTIIGGAGIEDSTIVNATARIESGKGN